MVSIIRWRIQHAMKNRKLFTLTAVIIMLFAMAAPVFAQTFYDQDNGTVFASAWTFWDDEQFETSMPYLDVWIRCFKGICLQTNCKRFEITLLRY